MSRLTLLDIGIPVYNEQSNIVELLNSLLGQNLGSNIKLNKIIIYDDASTDDTVKKIQNLNLKNINLIISKHNQGKATGLNEIFNHSNADYLLTVDSDLILPNNNFVKMMLTKTIDQKADMSNSWYRYVEKNNLFKNVFEFSAVLLLKIAETKPFYGCWGGAMIIKKDFFSKISIPSNFHRIDGYLYLLCRSMRKKYLLIDDMMLLDTKSFRDMRLSDYAKIRSRSNSFPAKYFDIFNEIDLGKEIDLSLYDQIVAMAKSSINHPIKAFNYLLVRLISKIYLKNYKNDNKTLWRS